MSERPIDALIERLIAKFPEPLVEGARDDLLAMFAGQGLTVTVDVLEGALTALVEIVEMQTSMIASSPKALRKLLRPRMDATVIITGALAHMIREQREPAAGASPA